MAWAFSFTSANQIMILICVLTFVTLVVQLLSITILVMRYRHRNKNNQRDSPVLYSDLQRNLAVEEYLATNNIVKRKEQALSNKIHTLSGNIDSEVQAEIAQLGRITSFISEGADKTATIRRISAYNRGKTVKYELGLQKLNTDLEFTKNNLQQLRLEKIQAISERENLIKPAYALLNKKIT